MRESKYNNIQLYQDTLRYAYANTTTKLCVNDVIMHKKYKMDTKLCSSGNHIGADINIATWWQHLHWIACRINQQLNHLTLIHLEALVPGNGAQKAKAHEKAHKEAHKAHELQNQGNKVDNLVLAPLRTDLIAEQWSSRAVEQWSSRQRIHHWCSSKSGLECIIIITRHAQTDRSTWIFSIASCVHTSSISSLQQQQPANLARHGISCISAGVMFLKWLLSSPVSTQHVTEAAQHTSSTSTTHALYSPSSRRILYWPAYSPMAASATHRIPTTMNIQATHTKPPTKYLLSQIHLRICQSAPRRNNAYSCTCAVCCCIS